MYTSMQINLYAKQKAKNSLDFRNIFKCLSCRGIECPYLACKANSFFKIDRYRWDGMKEGKTLEIKGKYDWVNMAVRVIFFFCRYFRKWHVFNNFLEIWRTWFFSECLRESGLLLLLLLLLLQLQMLLLLLLLLWVSTTITMSKYKSQDNRAPIYSCVSPFHLNC